MKKVTATLLTVILTLTLLKGNARAFTDYTGTTQYTGSVNPYSVMLFDPTTGMILYQKNIDQRIEPASTTKIMTCLLALESGKLDQEVAVSSKAAGQLGSLLHVYEGEKIVLKDLISGMMMVSGNDAAVATAEFLGGDIDGFAVMMNTKAAELGMTQTHFTVPHGMHDDEHYSTARDMATLTAYAIKNPEFAHIVAQPSYTMPADNKYSSEWKVENTNKLLQMGDPYYYQYATGIKTGSTRTAGDCLISSATKDGMTLVCLVFKDEFNGRERWPLTKGLFEWGFGNFITVDLATLLAKTEPVQAAVENAAANDSGVLDFNAPEAGSAYVTLERAVAQDLLDNTDTIATEKSFNNEPLKAPIAKDDVLGTVTYKSAATGTVLYTGNLIASRDVPEAGPGPDSSSDIAVATQTPAPLNNNEEQGDASVWWWLLIPAALISFVVVRLLTVNQRKRKRFNHHKPHYSYKIRKP